MFSDQVFELHKLIEVQRLIAGTLNVPINELYFGMGNMRKDSDHGCSCDCPDKDKDTVKALGKQSLTSESVGRDPVLVGKAKPNCSMNLGVATWATAAAAQSGACPYRPFVGEQTPGQAKGDPSTPVILGHKRASVGSPSFPYNFPASSERPHCTLTGPQSGYFSVVASAHQQQPVVCRVRSSKCKVVDQSEARTLNSRYCELEGSTTSVASINKELITPPHQTRAARYIMNFHSQRHEEAIESGRNGPRVCGSKVKKLQHTSTGLKPNISRVRSLDDGHQQSHEDLMEAVDMVQDNFIEKFSKEARGSKRQKERATIPPYRNGTR